MGNTHTDVTEKVKAQIYASRDTETYRLLDIKGGGELIQLMKDPILAKNSEQLDDAIRKKVIDAIYDEGKGRDVRLKLNKRN